MPIIAVAATNHEVTCETAKKTGAECDSFIASRNAVIQIAKEQAALGAKGSAMEECPGFCEHDFVYTHIDYVMQIITKYVKTF